MWPDRRRQTLHCPKRLSSSCDLKSWVTVRAKQACHLHCPAEGPAKDGTTVILEGGFRFTGTWVDDQKQGYGILEQPVAWQMAVSSALLWLKSDKACQIE